MISKYRTENKAEIRIKEYKLKFKYKILFINPKINEKSENKIKGKKVPKTVNPKIKAIAKSNVKGSVKTKKSLKQ